jgi:hypothetical protein
MSCSLNNEPDQFIPQTSTQPGLLSQGTLQSPYPRDAASEQPKRTEDWRMLPGCMLFRLLRRVFLCAIQRQGELRVGHNVSLHGARGYFSIYGDNDGGPEPLPGVKLSCARTRGRQ